MLPSSGLATKNGAVGLETGGQMQSPTVHWQKKSQLQYAAF